MYHGILLSNNGTDMARNTVKKTPNKTGLLFSSGTTISNKGKSKLTNKFAKIKLTDMSKTSFTKD